MGGKERLASMNILSCRIQMDGRVLNIPSFECCRGLPLSRMYVIRSSYSQASQLEASMCSVDFQAACPAALTEPSC